MRHIEGQRINQSQHKPSDGKIGDSTLVDVMFFFRIIGIVVFATIDIIITALSKIPTFFAELFKEENMEIISGKYNAYLERVHVFKHKKDVSARTVNKKIYKIRKEFFSEKEARLIFGHDDIKRSLKTRKKASSREASNYYPIESREIRLLHRKKNSKIVKERVEMPKMRHKWKEGAMKFSFLWLKKSAERPHEQKLYNRAVRIMVAKSNLKWAKVKSEYNKYIEQRIYTLAKPSIKNNLHHVIAYYQNPTKSNFKKLCDYAKGINKDKLVSLLKLIGKLDFKFRQTVEAAIG
ncbi:MAG: hypothetical protein GY754_39865 [bacterium]|nr:hypothetical protein [bacterium]